MTEVKINKETNEISGCKKVTIHSHVPFEVAGNYLNNPMENYLLTFSVISRN